MRLSLSTPGEYVRARVLVPRNPSVTSSPEALKGFAAILHHEAAMHANLVNDQLQNSLMEHI